MIYYTQLIYVQDGKQETFHAFEDAVLPLLAKYEGELMLRIRPTSDTVIAAATEVPYEIHIVSFPAKANFDAYVADESRKLALHLKDESVIRVLLIEGSLVQ